MGVELDIIEPCGFIWNKSKIRKSALDYYDKITITRHESWKNFHVTHNKNRRIILMTTKAAQPYTSFTFQEDDILLADRESAGVPDEVHNSVDGAIYIPMQNGLRSLNIVNATSMILGEALRQTKA
jgi:tRNA (cytidine/uridine-2'-O-)-methyltransferase